MQGKKYMGEHHRLPCHLAGMQADMARKSYWLKRFTNRSNAGVRLPCILALQVGIADFFPFPVSGAGAVFPKRIGGRFPAFGSLPALIA